MGKALNLLFCDLGLPLEDQWDPSKGQIWGFSLITEKGILSRSFKFGMFVYVGNSSELIVFRDANFRLCNNLNQTIELLLSVLLSVWSHDHKSSKICLRY